MKLQKVFSSRVGSRVLRLCVLGLFTLALGAFRPVLAATGPDLSIAKSHVGDFTEGDTGKTYTLTVNNVGDAPTNGTTVTVADVLPAGLTATDFSGTGWSCTLDPLECTRSDVLAATASFPDLTLTVDVDVNVDPLLTNEASVSGGGDVNSGNDVDFDDTNIIQVADLTINKSHTGNFTQGEQGKTYTITVTNNGDGSTNGLVTVTDSLPAGLTATNLSGTGWSCTLATLTCTRSSALDSGLSYPNITLTVNVAVNAPEEVTNQVTVSGGGEANTVNNTDSDLTTIILMPDLIITNVTLSPATPIPGQPFDVNITVKNQGGLATPTIVYRDVYIDRDPSTFIDPETGCPTEDGDYFRSDYNDGLPPGVSDTKAVNVTNGLSVGSHQIWVYTDATCINDESIEDNNVFGPINITLGVQNTLASLGPQDGWLLETSETSGVGGKRNKGSSLLFIGDDAANRQYRAILSFNTASLPDTAVITKVILKFKYAGLRGTLPFNTHGNLLVDIRKGPFSGNVNLQLADFKSPPSKSQLLTYNKTKVNNWYSRTFSAANFQYINKLGLTQFRLRFFRDDNHDFGADYLKIYSGNAGAANRPKLIIQYYVP